jgi:germination protein M
LGKIIRISFLCFFIIVILVGCNNNTSKTEQETISGESIKLFLSNKEKNSLVSKDVNIKSIDNNDIVKEIVALLKNGLEDSDTISTVPDEVRILEVKINDSKVILNFSKEYNEMDAVDEIMCRTSIMATLTELDFIDTVEIYVGEVPLKGNDGKAIGPKSKDDLVIDGSEKEQKPQKKVVLYFADEEGTGLIKEEVDITVNPNEPIEKTVLNLLIKGPKYDTQVRTIPVETKIISTSIKEGVCYVDFSNEFRSKHLGGSTGEYLTVYSIVNTLTELPDINKVQFLIEGEKQEQFKGHLQFNILFERNLDLVIENK